MRLINTLRLAKDEVFFGPGPRMLLENIDQQQSLQKASRKTGISYPKALRLLHKMEKELGFAVTEAYKGGADHGGTRLTELGRRFLRAYDEMERELKSYAQQLMEEKFSDFPVD